MTEGYLYLFAEDSTGEIGKGDCEAPLAEDGRKSRAGVDPVAPI